MEDNFYRITRQKFLFMVEELHKRGFGKLPISPYKKEIQAKKSA